MNIEKLRQQRLPDLFSLLSGKDLVDTSTIPLYTSKLTDHQRRILEQRSGQSLEVGRLSLPRSRTLYPKPMEIGLMETVRKHSHDSMGVILWARSYVHQHEKRQPLTGLELADTLSLVEALPQYLRYRARDTLQNIPVPILGAQRIVMGLNTAVDQWNLKYGETNTPSGIDIYTLADTVQKGSSLLVGARKFSCPAPKEMIVGFTDAIVQGAKETQIHDHATCQALHSVHPGVVDTFRKASEKIYVSLFYSDSYTIEDVQKEAKMCNTHLRSLYGSLGYHTHLSLTPESYTHLRLQMLAFTMQNDT